ncbi:hypothetical protein TcasGA2_TC010971 [Tribolium castaneum]|uniref:Uncharacterized protein n=1 Tax=Tribolium castaneum TaxID=7070 RepID=D6X1G9_TRICA|nr:hypothetical protein TcasGA2_TC010971 [Tribolium castaneum]
MRRRLFAGMKSLTGFGSRSRHGSPGHRSISLPESTRLYDFDVMLVLMAGEGIYTAPSRRERNSQDASGTRPFGQPLCIGPQINDKNGLDLPPTPPSPSPSKGKAQPILKKGSKSKK